MHESLTTHLFRMCMLYDSPIGLCPRTRFSTESEDISLTNISTSKLAILAEIEEFYGHYTHACT